MKSPQISEELVSTLFREEALLIGRLAANHDLEDDLVWELCRNLDLIRLRFMKKIGQNKPNHFRFNSSPHPAVRELLRKIKES